MRMKNDIFQKVKSNCFLLGCDKLGVKSTIYFSFGNDALPFSYNYLKKNLIPDCKPWIIFIQLSAIKVAPDP